MDRALGGRVHYTVQPSSLQNNSAAPTWSELLSSRQFNSVQSFVRLNVFILFVLFCFHFFFCVVAMLRKSFESGERNGL